MVRKWTWGRVVELRCSLRGGGNECGRGESGKPTVKVEGGECFSLPAPRLGIVQKGLGAGFAYFGPRMADGICNLGFGIWDFKRENTGFWCGGGGVFATGGFAQWELCNARGEVGFLHNSPRWWRNGVAKLDFSGGGSHLETGGIGARTLRIERHPALQKWPELCEKTTKTGVLAAKSNKAICGSGCGERSCRIKPAELCKNEGVAFAERRRAESGVNWASLAARPSSLDPLLRRGKP